MKPQRIITTKLAGVEYSGKAGVTADCVRAIARLIYSGELIKKGHLITCGQYHAFVLYDQDDDVFVIKNGFTSGYSGEGPKGLSAALQLLDRHNIDVEEIEVDQKVMDRLECSCLLEDDIASIASGRPVLPHRIADYRLWSKEGLECSAGYLTRCCPLTVPFGLVDARIMDLAVKFHENEDSAIVDAYRRLEDRVRERTNIAEHGTKLFARAFHGDKSPLTWKVKDANEAAGRANMFVSIFGAFRNARMHRKQKLSYENALREFLLVNELFLLESNAIRRNAHAPADG